MLHRPVEITGVKRTFDLNEFLEIRGPFPECPRFPKAVVQIGENGANSKSAFGQNRTVNNQIIDIVIRSKRPEAPIVDGQSLD